MQRTIDTCARAATTRGLRRDVVAAAARRCAYLSARGPRETVHVYIVLYTQTQRTPFLVFAIFITIVVTPLL